MRRLSHLHLGMFLAEHHMPNAPKRYIRAFLIGCTEPDKNPATYLKGSIRSQWFRGHNWNNARRFMGRISRRLEKKKRLCLIDYYTMGKLVHYTADAFTYCHNDFFGNNLHQHRQYETNLQCYFLEYLRHHKPQYIKASSIMDAIHTFHKAYSRRPGNIVKDTHYALSACNLIVSNLPVNGKIAKKSCSTSYISSMSTKHFT